MTVVRVMMISTKHFSLKLLIVIYSWVTLDEPTESEKQVMQAKSYISDSYDYSHEFQMVEHMILGNIGNLTDHSHQKWVIIMIFLSKKDVSF